MGLPRFLNLFVAAAILLAPLPSPRLSWAGCIGDAEAILRGNAGPSGASSLTPGETARVLERVGLDQEEASLMTFRAGAMNQVYRIRSDNPYWPAQFRDSPQVPKGLRGKRTEKLVLKVAAGHVGPEMRQRDLRMYVAIKGSLKDPQYEGLHLTPTYFFEAERPGEPRVLVQNESQGVELYEALKPFFKPALGDPSYPRGRARDLFAILIEDDLRGVPPTDTFKSKNLVDLQGNLLVATDQARLELQRSWETDPELTRIRVLLRRLYLLSRSRSLVQAGTPMFKAGLSIQNTMPWTTGRNRLKPAYFLPRPFWGTTPSTREHATGDFSFKNFNLYKDQLGIWQLEIFDF